MWWLLACTAREPTELALAADPNGLWWDGRGLYLADDDTNRVLRWTDADGVAAVGGFDGPPGLGQVVVAPDGRLVAPIFGFGSAGYVGWLSEDGAQSGQVSGLSPARRRVGLTVAPDGALYDAWFTHDPDGHHGGVSRLSLDGGEVDVLTGLGKAVGVVVLGGTLYASDRGNDRILAVDLATGASRVFATIDGPDLLAAGPDGALLAGTAAGVALLISPDGTSEELFSRPGYEVRGLAWDAAGRRLFVGLHDVEPADGVHHALRIIPR